MNKKTFSNDLLLQAISNDLLLQAINSGDYDIVSKFAKLSNENKISLDKHVVDAAKSKGLTYVDILLRHAHNAVSTFVEYMSPDDDIEIFKIALYRHNADIDKIIHNAVTRECYNIINILIFSHIDKYNIFKLSFSHGKKNVINYLREYYISEHDLYFLFHQAYSNRDFKLVKYCIDECDTYHNSFIDCIIRFVFYSLDDTEKHESLECLIMILNKRGINDKINIDWLPVLFPDDMLLLMSKLGVNYFGKFSIRMGIIFIREYERRERVRETIPEIPDELTNLIMGY